MRRLTTDESPRVGHGLAVVGRQIQGRDAAQARDDGGKMLQDMLHDGHGRLRAQGETDATMHEFVGIAEGGEDVRRLQALGIAGRSGVDHDVVLVELQEQGLAFDVQDRDVQEVRQAPRRVAIQDDFVDRAENPLLQSVAQARHMRRAFPLVCFIELHRQAEADDGRDVLCTRT